MIKRLKIKKEEKNKEEILGESKPELKKRRKSIHKKFTALEHAQALENKLYQKFDKELKAGCCAGEKNKRKIRKYCMIQKDENSIINAVFLGENSVGKTCIINRIKKKDFNPSETHTEQFSEFIYK